MVGRKQESKKARRGTRCAVLLAVLVAMVLTVPPAKSESAENPDPRVLLRVARLASAGQTVSLRGQLRSGTVKMPFVLQVNNGNLRYVFPQSGRVLEVHLGDDASGVYDSKGRPLGKGMQEPVAHGAHFTVEDLSMGFLYWPDARLIGEEKVRGRGTWKIELRPGRTGSEFAVVRVWLDRASGALMRIEGFDWEGRLLRRFEVVSGQRIDGQWMLRQMRIEKFAPGGGSRPLERSYLEILGKDGI